MHPGPFPVFLGRVVTPHRGGCLMGWRNTVASPTYILTMNSLAETLVQQVHLEQAEDVCRCLVLEGERLLGADDCDTFVGVHTLADTLQGRPI